MLEILFHESCYHFVFTQKSMGEELKEYDYVMRFIFSRAYGNQSVYYKSPQERGRL